MENWHSIRVFYHDDTDLLVTHGIRPFLGSVAAHVTAAWFTRQWQQGPHVRVDVRCGPRQFVNHVLPGAHRVLGAFLAEHPSRSSLSQQDFAARERRLAVLEERQRVPEPWAPDNTILVVPHEDRSPVLGSDGAALVTDFYVGTTEHAFAMTERVLGGESRAACAFDLLVATAHVLSGVGIEAGFVSFRSHAEGFLSGFPEGAALRPAWERHSRRHRAALADRLRAVVETAAGAGDTPATTWARAVSPYRRRAAVLIRGGSSLLSGLEPPEAGAGVTPLTETSDFHRAMLASPGWASLRSAQGFLLYRLMLNLTYLHLTRLGVTASERFLLCHLVADAAEEVFGVRASEVVRRSDHPFQETLAGDRI